MAYGTGGVGYSAQGNLRTTVTSLKASGSSKEDVVSSIVNSGRFSQWRELANVIRIIYDSLDGVAHATLTQTYDIHSQIPQVSLALLTGDSDFSPLLVRVGVEFQINIYNIGDQRIPSIAGLTGGGFVAAWISLGQDTSGNGIFAQRYDGNYNRAGTLEFQVNDYVIGTQTEPSVTGLTAGGFAITWSSNLQDGDNYGVYAKVYDTSGNVVKAEFLINTQTVNLQGSSAIASLTNDGFVVTWVSFGQDGWGYGIFAQVYGPGPSYNTVNTEFQVNTNTPYHQAEASITGLSNGGFAIVWSSYNDGEVYAQIYDASYNTVNSEFQVNTYTTDSQRYSSVASLSNNWFVVTWSSFGQDGDGWGIYAKIYDVNGNVIKEEFQVNTYTTGDQVFSSVTSLDTGGFVITWESSLQDGDGKGIYAQIYDVNGDSVNTEFQINTYTTGDQQSSSVAGLSNISGRFVTAWSSDGQDGSDEGIYGQVWEPV